MAARETMGSGIEPTLIQRVSQGLKYVITGAGPESWFGPMQPLQPVAQEQSEGRVFDFPVGVNQRTTPRSTEANPFYVMRNLADGYDMLRLVIETRKDQIKSFEWEIVPTDEDANVDALKDQIKLVREFFERPDGEHTWDDWLSMFVEDLLVIDAVAVYPALTRGGRVHAFELIDAATITRKIDATGRTPRPPEVAYQQMLHGVPANSLSADQLVYMMRNPRTSRLYGFSPVEQIIMTVNIALRRQVSQLEFYTSGNVPEAIAQVPETWTPKQVEQMQLMWDTLNEGNTAQRRKMRFIPSLKDIVFPKAQILKDEYDEWLARIVCFAFSIPPTSFIKQNNRATGEQAADTAKEEGLMPLMRWLQNKLNFLISKHLGMSEVKFKWKIENAIDPLVQAQVDDLYLTGKVITPEEVRERMGMGPLTDQQKEAAWPTPKEPELPQGKIDPLTGLPYKEPVAPRHPEDLAAAKAKQEQKFGKRDTAQPPQVIEFRPEVHVSLGDSIVNTPKHDVTVNLGGEGQVAKRDDTAAMDKLAEAIASREPITINVAQPSINVEQPEVNVAVGDTIIQNQQPDVNATINVAAPVVEHHTPITVEGHAVNVEAAKPFATRETFERDGTREIVAINRKPVE